MASMIRNPEKLQALLAEVRAFVRERWHPLENTVEQLDHVPDDIVNEHMGLDEAHTGDEAEKKFNKYNDKELDHMLDRAYGRSQPGDAHKQKRAGQAKDAAYNIMWKKKN